MSLDLLLQNLLSPMVLAFVLGTVAGLLRSDLRIPEAMHTSLSIYLLFAIGLKGGAGLATAEASEVWAPALGTLALGCAIPLWSFGVLRRLGKFGIADSAALAAHYGSTSAVTFMATLVFLEQTGQTSESFMTALLAVLEVPAIVVALLLARRRLDPAAPFSHLLHEVLAGKSVVLLIGGLVIGTLAGEAGAERVAPFFVDPFHGVLTLFLLEMGVSVSERLREVREAGLFLVAFSIAAPLLHGTAGAAVGAVTGLSVGGSTLLAVLAASASYIAAPAAVRLALPQANPGLYLTASLALTFPFNLAFGIPLFYAIASRLAG
ncbi:MAG: sodium-dependent bicarbonate transport family permease [Acidobacteriota bacterium]